MDDCCCAPPPLNLGGNKKQDQAYRRVLWAVLAINAAMFAVEVVAGLAAGSASLQADSLDFLGDAANYAISLLGVVVYEMLALRRLFQRKTDYLTFRAVMEQPIPDIRRYRPDALEPLAAALAKGVTMAAFGVWVLGTVVWHSVQGTLPNAFAMGSVGAAALTANAASFGLLWAYRRGDANMRSAWICTRNDVLGNLAVLLAAAGVFGTGTGWPDIIVAAVMAALAIQGSVLVIRQASAELRMGQLAAAE